MAICKAVREVRVFGLLIGIELEATGLPQRWFKKRLFWFYLAAMLKHPRFPVLIGFCQYEPNVLKITPPLTVNPDEIREMCATIGEVLRRPFYQLMTSAAGGVLKSLGLCGGSDMTPLTNRPMRLLLVEFHELYARHLCRHSQLGINVAHLIALFATWYAIYGLLFWSVGIEWMLAVLAAEYAQ